MNELNHNKYSYVKFKNDNNICY